MVDSMSPCFTPRIKEVEKWKKMNQCPPAHHLLNVKLCGPIASSAHPLETYYKSICEQTTIKEPW